MQNNRPTDFRQQVRKWDKHIHAFVAFAEGDADAPSPTLPLSGLSVGVKDVIDVAGLPTRNGSDACRAATPAAQDAEVVAALRAAGARIVGKTTTTEFAFTDPTDCRNPYDQRRTPGGSSSGSGAAVAAGLVDIALGTQTAGSLCRPAAYCGAVGFKPTYGALSSAGVTPLAPSFDTVGIITGSVDLARRCFDAATGQAGGAQVTASDLSVVAGCLDTEASPAQSAQEALSAASDALKQLTAGFVETELPVDVARVVQDHRMVMNFEAFRAHQGLLVDDGATRLRPKFLAGLRAGSAISPQEAGRAAARLRDARHHFWDKLRAVDIILTLPVPDGAPLIDGTTGYQDWLTPWTVMGGPLISLPWGLDDLGRPRAVMLAAHPGQDEVLLTVAQALESRAPLMPPPKLPTG